MELYSTNNTTRKSKGKIGNFFFLNMTDVRSLIDKGIGPDALHALLVLAAATDEGNRDTRAGRKAIATALGCSTRAADKLVQKLIAFGAIESLEDQMGNIRNPTAARFRLRQSIPTDTETGTARANNLVPVSNALPKSPDFRRAVNLAGSPAITTLLELSRDPCGSQWPPRWYAKIDSQELARLGDYSLHYLSPDSLLRAVLKLEEYLPSGVTALATFGLVFYDIHSAAFGSDTHLIAIDPIASLQHGLVDRSGPFSAVADAVRMLSAQLRFNTDARTDEAKCTAHADPMMALLPNRIPVKKIILRPRLKILPRDAETIAQEERLWADGEAAAARVTGIAINLRSNKMIEGRPSPCKAAP